MQPSGYRLVRESDGAIIESWGGEYGVFFSPPAMIKVPRGDGAFDFVHCPEVGERYNGHYLEIWMMEAPPVTPENVNAERDRRIANGFAFGGKMFDFDPASKQRVTGAATLAGFAMIAGAQPGYVLWHGGAEPFAFIAKDNTLMQMDAQTCFAFGQTAAAHESAHIFAARALKDLPEIPENYQSDEYWP